MAEKRVRIEHSDGRAYDVSEAAFRKLYEPEGFRITANADGTAYEAPKPARAATKSRDRKAAARKGAATKAARAAAAASAIDSSAAASDAEDEGPDA